MYPVKWHLNALFLRFYLKKNACEEYYDRIKILIIRHLKYCLLLHLGFFLFYSYPFHVTCNVKDWS